LNKLRYVDGRILVLVSFFLMICLMIAQFIILERHDDQDQIELTELIEMQARIQLKVKDAHVRFNQQVTALENYFVRRKDGSARKLVLKNYFQREKATQNLLDEITSSLNDARFESLIGKLREIHHSLSERFREVIEEKNTRNDGGKLPVDTDEVLGNSSNEFTNKIYSLNDLVTRVYGEKIEELHKIRKNRHLLNWLLVGCVSIPLIIFLFVLLDRKVKALRETEANFASLTANMQDGVIVRYSGEHVFANQHLASMLGYKNANELIGTRMEELIHPEDLDLVLHRSQQRQQGKSVPSVYEIKLLTRNGEPVPVEVCASMTTWKGKAAGMVTIRDITERKKSENILKESEARYQRAERGTSDGLWEWNIITGDNYFSPRWLEMLGYEDGDLLHHLDSFIELIHPDDKSVVQQAVEDHLQNNKPYNIDMRLRCKNGDYLWVNSRGQAENNEQGMPALMTGVISDISRRRQAEEELQKSELWMTNIFNTLAEAVLVVTPDRELLNINNAAIKMFGYSIEEIAKSSTELFHVDHEHYIEFGNRIGSAFAEGKVAHFEFEAKRKNGEIFPTEHYVSILKSPDGTTLGIVSVVIDITERKESEERVSRLAAIVRHSSDFIGFADINGRPRFLNTAGRQMVGIESNEEFYNKWLPDYFSHQDQEFVENTILPQVMETGRWSGEFRFQHFQTGELIPVWFDIFCIDDPVTGEPYQLATITRDISEKKHNEEELNHYRERLEELVEERTRELKNAQDELVRKERLATLGQLTATVSHELRNPLGAMRPSLYFISKKINKEDKNLQQAIEILDRNIQRCDHIIDELLDFTRITDIELHSTRIDDWLDAVVNEQQFPEEIKLEKHYSLDSIDVPIDSDRLRRAVINVLENACHAMMDENQKVINRKNAHLDIKTGINTECGNRIEITVTDNGCGIPPDLKEKIFEPLFSTKTFGVGLGMSTVRQIMVQHSGGIEINSKQGEGTSVILWLPGVVNHEV